VSAVCVLLATGGCQTQQPAFADANSTEAAKSSETKPSETPKPDVIVLHEGDTLRISFPGAPTLNTVQQIRRDGRVTLSLIGEFKAAGLTPPDMEKELITLYGPQLQTKEVTVVSARRRSAIFNFSGSALRKYSNF